MLTIACILLLAITSVWAISKKTMMFMPFVIVPIAVALLLGFTPAEVGEFAQTGVKDSMNAIFLMIFAVLYFGTMSETGVFEILVQRLLRLTNGNIYLIYYVAMLLGMIGQLDGSATTTYLIAIPPLLPLFKKLNLDRRTLVLTVALGAAPMNVLPWADPASKAIYAPEIDPAAMTRFIFPAFVFSLAMVAVIVFTIATREKKAHSIELDAIRNKFLAEQENTKADLSALPYARPEKFVLNLVILIVSLLTFVLLTEVKTYILFVLFLILLLCVNYKPKDQKEVFVKNAADIIDMAVLMICIGVMVGVLRGSGMIDSLATGLLSIIPKSVARYTHVFWNIIRPSIDIFVPYQAFTTMNSLLVGIGAACGLSAYKVLGSLCITFGQPCSPLIGPNLIAARLAECDDFVGLAKFCWPYVFACQLLMSLFCVIAGLA